LYDLFINIFGKKSRTMIFYRQNKSDNTETVCLLRQQSCTICTDERVSDSVTNYNYVGDTKISVSIKKLMPTNAP